MALLHGFILARIEEQLAQINSKLVLMQGRLDAIFRIAQEEMEEMTALDDQITQLQQDVANETSVTQSAVTMINGIAQQIQDAVQQALSQGATQDQLQALTDLGTAISNQSTALAQAVQQNTPPAPSPGPTPPQGRGPQAASTQPGGPARTGGPGDPRNQR